MQENSEHGANRQLVSAAIGAGRAGLVLGGALRGNRVGGLPIVDEGLAAAI